MPAKEDNTIWYIVGIGAALWVLYNYMNPEETAGTPLTAGGGDNAAAAAPLQLTLDPNARDSGPFDPNSPENAPINNKPPASLAQPFAPVDDGPIWAQPIDPSGGTRPTFLGPPIQVKDYSEDEIDPIKVPPFGPPQMDNNVF